MLTSKTDEWEAPQWLFDKLNEEFEFTLDPCATTQIAKCPAYFTRQTDGLNNKWFGSVFVNPPHSRLYEWVRKANEESTRYGQIVIFLPARADTSWLGNPEITEASRRA